MAVPKTVFLAFLLVDSLVMSADLDFASADLLDVSELAEAGRVKPAKTGPKPPPSEPDAIQCGCGEEEFIIDFSQFSQGDYVTEISTNNMFVKAIGSKDGESFTPDEQGLHAVEGGAARIFDSNDPRPDFDLGSPNRGCPSPGPGLGDAGTPGMEGENCVPQGNLLIIQRREKLRPDDAEDGGSFVFTLDPSTKWRLLSLGMLDVAENVRVNIFTKKRYNNEVDMRYFDGLGPNGYQEVVLEVPIRWHSEIRIELPGDGGLSWMKFCQPERKPTPPGATAQRRLGSHLRK